MDVIHGGLEGSFHAVVGSETSLNCVKELVVVDVLDEVSVDDFL